MLKKKTMIYKKNSKNIKIAQNIGHAYKLIQNIVVSIDLAFFSFSLSQCPHYCFESFYPSGGCFKVGHCPGRGLWTSSAAVFRSICGCI